MLVNEEELSCRKKLVRVKSSNGLVSKRRDISYLKENNQQDVARIRWQNIESIVRSIEKYNKIVKKGVKELSIETFGNAVSSIFTFD